MVKAHHERYDGLGYPEGLKGDEIPFGAAIIFVVDAYVFMISSHPFRDAKSHKEAVDEIIDQKGRQFHPKAVDSFLKYFRNTEKLRKGDKLD